MSKGEPMNTEEQLAKDAAGCEALEIPFNPKLPPDFDDTPNERRPPSHQRWWHQPFIVTVTVESWDAHYATLADDVRRKSQV
jgi:hypothetical protein